MSVGGESVSCTTCGTSIRSSARFCESCGAPQAAAGWADPAAVETAIQGADEAVAPAPVHAVEVEQAAEDKTTRLWAGAPSAPPDPPAAQPAATPPPPARPAPAPPAPARPPRPSGPDWQKHLPPPFNTIPQELLAAYVLTTIAGSLTLYPAIRVLPDISGLLGESGFAEQVGLLSLTVWAILALAGIALIFLAWRMVHRDHVAHGLALVLLAGLAGSIVVGNQKPTDLVLALLAALGAIAVLALTPQIKAFFDADTEPQPPAEPNPEAQPTPILLARTLIAIWAALISFVGVMFLPLSDLGGKFLPIGIMFIALGVSAWFYNGRIGQRDPAARAVITTATGVYLVLLLVLGERHPGLLLPLGLATGIVVNLWVPSQSQRHFVPT